MAETTETRNQSKLFSETEAAEYLGLSRSQLRMLVTHLIEGDEDIPSDPVFRAADLVLLRMIASGAMQPNGVTA